MDRLRNALILAAVVWSAARPAAAQQADLPIPTEFDTVYVALLIRTGGGPTDSAAVERLFLAHVQFKLRLLADGSRWPPGPPSPATTRSSPAFRCSEQAASPMPAASPRPTPPFARAASASGSCSGWCRADGCDNRAPGP